MPKTSRRTRAPSASEAAAPDRQAIVTWLAVVRAYNLCDAVLTARLAVHGVKVVEHEVLAYLLRDPGLTQQQLTARVFFAKSHLSGLLGQMEAAGLVRRDADPSDARVKRLTLTAAGATLAERTGAVQQEIVAAMTDGYPQAELQYIEAAMTDVSARLEAVQAADAVAAAAEVVSRASAPRSRRAPPARRG